MEKKFYREHNAKSIKGANITVPTKEELQLSLIEKLREKAEHINVLINEDDRRNYLTKKGKDKQVETLTEQEIKTVLAKRLLVDLLQLFLDLQKSFHEHLKLNLSLRKDFGEAEIQKELFWCCDKLISKKTKSEIFEELAINIYTLSCLYELNLDELEQERKEVEEKEGNFYNGKFVII